LNNSTADHESFLMPIDAVFKMRGNGTVVVGKVQRGTLSKGAEIIISGNGKTPITTRVSTFEGVVRNPGAFVAQPGENCAIVLHEVEVHQLEPGMVITGPSD
jgi:elongation factor Tu